MTLGNRRGPSSMARQTARQWDRREGERAQDGSVHTWMYSCPDVRDMRDRRVLGWTDIVGTRMRSHRQGNCRFAHTHTHTHYLIMNI